MIKSIIRKKIPVYSDKIYKQYFNIKSKFTHKSIFLSYGETRSEPDV